MCPNKPTIRPMRPIKRIAGFSLLLAIFFLLALGSLLAVILAMFTGQTAESTLFLQNRQAYYAALAGIEWAGYAIKVAEVDASTPGQYTCPATTSFTMPSGSSAAAFTVTVLCTVKTGTPTYSAHTYEITSTATLGSASSSRFIQQSVTAHLYYPG